MKLNSANTSTIPTLQTRTPPMRLFTRVFLVATDLSGPGIAVLRIATHLASLLGAQLSVLHVFEYWKAASNDVLQTVEGVDALRRTAQHHLDRAMRVVHRAKVCAEATIEDGLAADSILAAANAKKSDLIVMGTNALRGVDRLTYGSTAEVVLRKATCPVLTVGPRAIRFYKVRAIQDPIVFATDFNEDTVQAVQYGASLCKVLGAELHCIHVLPPSTRRKRAVSAPEIMTAALRYVLEKHQVEVDRRICSIAYGNEIHSAVVKYAEEHKAQLIVLGVRRAGTIASHLPAQITCRIIAESPCPVLTIAM